MFHPVAALAALFLLALWISARCVQGGLNPGLRCGKLENTRLCHPSGWQVGSPTYLSSVVICTETPEQMPLRFQGLFSVVE